MSRLGRSGKHDLEGRPAGSLHFRARRRPRLPWSLIVLAIIGLLFWLIPPIQSDIDIPASLTESATRFPLPPTFTPLPKPTDVHGGQIVFTCTRGDYNQLCMINTDGSGLQRLSNHGAHDYYPTFAPQGDAIIFASNRNGGFDLYMLILSSAKLYQLTQGVGNAFSPDFSPDGKMIVFANRPAEGPSSLWLMESTGENPRLLYAGPNAIVGAAWSPSVDLIAFAMTVDQPDAYEIYLLDSKETDQPPRRLTHDLMGIGGSLDWSPDGKYLLVCAGPPGDKDIFRIEAASGAILQLTNGGNNAAASYSPDGQKIVFNSLRNDEQADLFVMNADGTYQRQLTDDPEPDWQPQWEP